MLLLTKHYMSDKQRRKYSGGGRYKGVRITVTLPQGTWKIIEEELLGKLGDNAAEVLRNIVIAWLVEHGFIKKEKEKEGDQS